MFDRDYVGTAAIEETAIISSYITSINTNQGLDQCLMRLKKYIKLQTQYIFRLSTVLEIAQNTHVELV